MNKIEFQLVVVVVVVDKPVAEVGVVADKLGAVVVDIPAAVVVGNKPGENYFSDS